MTARTDATPAPLADALNEQLTELRNAPMMQRGDQAVQFGAMTIAAIRRLEIRLANLEGCPDAT